MCKIESPLLNSKQFWSAPKWECSNVLANNRQYQRHRINRSLNHIRDHLTGHLNLDQLADAACLSKYHFIRVFHQHLGETPNQFISRRRLECATAKLIFRPNSSITDIALDSGFSGSDVFARAFRAKYRRAPRSIKNADLSIFEELGQGCTQKYEIFKPGHDVLPIESSSLSVNIEFRPAYYVCYLRHIGSFGDAGNSITNTFTKLQDWARRRELLKPTSSFIGISHNDSNATPAGRCIYDAGMVMDDEIAEDDQVSVQLVPGGYYAILDVKCIPQMLNRYWDWFLGDWFSQSNLKRRKGIYYEYFPHSGSLPVKAIYGAQLCAPIENPNPPL